jgi:hypothetical protein
LEFSGLDTVKHGRDQKTGKRKKQRWRGKLKRGREILRPQHKDRNKYRHDRERGSSQGTHHRFCFARLVIVHGGVDRREGKGSKDRRELCRQRKERLHIAKIPQREQTTDNRMKGVIQHGDPHRRQEKSGRGSYV